MIQMTAAAGDRNGFDGSVAVPAGVEVQVASLENGQIVNCAMGKGDWCRIRCFINDDMPLVSFRNTIWTW